MTTPRRSRAWGIVLYSGEEPSGYDASACDSRETGGRWVGGQRHEREL
jgi:hypothetical protein